MIDDDEDDDHHHHCNCHHHCNNNNNCNGIIFFKPRSASPNLCPGWTCTVRYISGCHYYNCTFSTWIKAGPFTITDNWPFYHDIYAIIVTYFIYFCHCRYIVVIFHCILLREHTYRTTSKGIRVEYPVSSPTNYIIYTYSRMDLEHSVGNDFCTVST